jgi:hypothetical protein
MPVVVAWQLDPRNADASRDGSKRSSRNTLLSSALTLRSNTKFERTPSVKSGMGCGMTMAPSPGAYTRIV